MNPKRPGKIEYYLNLAREVAKRGTCLRRNFGVVIVNEDQIVSTGYVGAPRGTVNCIDIGRCMREENNIPKGQRYELCRSVHAEMNAIIHASRREMVGGSLFLSGGSATDGEIVPDAEPCKLCKRAIINAGIKYVYVMRAEDKFQKMIVEDWVANEDAVFYDSKKAY
jgi:dCMP deaminase